MEEKKEKKETSKGVRILIIILLSILLIYLVIPFITNIGNLGKTTSGRSTDYYIGLGIWLIIVFLCGYGIIINISKLRGKELTAEQLQKRKKKQKTAIIIMLVIIVGIVGGISLPNIFNDSNTNTQKETLDQYVGTWTQYNTMDKNRKGTLILDGKGNYSCRIVVETTFHPTDQTLAGTYKIDNNKITLYYSSGTVWEEYEIINSNVLRSVQYGRQLEYRK